MMGAPNTAESQNVGEENNMVATPDKLLNNSYHRQTQLHMYMKGNHIPILMTNIVNALMIVQCCVRTATYGTQVVNSVVLVLCHNAVSLEY